MIVPALPSGHPLHLLLDTKACLMFFYYCTWVGIFINNEQIQFMLILGSAGYGDVFIHSAVFCWGENFHITFSFYKKPTRRLFRTSTICVSLWIVWLLVSIWIKTTRLYFPFHQQISVSAWTQLLLLLSVVFRGYFKSTSFFFSFTSIQNPTFTLYSSIYMFTKDDSFDLGVIAFHTAHNVHVC